MPRAIRGVLVECEPAIKSIIVHLDSINRHEYIIEDLDESHLVVKESMVALLKAKLDEHLKETYRPDELLSGSE